MFLIVGGGTLDLSIKYHVKDQEYLCVIVVGWKYKFQGDNTVLSVCACNIK